MPSPDIAGITVANLLESILMGMLDKKQTCVNVEIDEGMNIYQCRFIVDHVITPDSTTTAKDHKQ